MPIIIDGWNFIRSDSSDISDDEESSIESAEALLRRLGEFQASHSDPIIVVFDSTREHLDLRFAGAARKITVVPARDADDYIKRYIEKTPERQRRGLRVVSDDNAVFYHAKSSYATPLRCSEFWGKLHKSAAHVSR